MEKTYLLRSLTSLLVTSSTSKRATGSVPVEDRPVVMRRRPNE